MTIDQLAEDSNEDEEDRIKLHKKMDNTKKNLNFLQYKLDNILISKDEIYK